MFLPQGGLAVSISSTVFVGVIVTSLMNLFFGRSLKGLVVPGFLVPLFIIIPSVAVINILEGVLTYLILKYVSSKLTEYDYIDSVYGREKYFAIIVTSVAVRIISDIFFLPKLTDILQNHFNYQFDFYNNFNGYGIVVVALIANQFWNSGLVKSILPFLFTTLLTYLIVRYVLMELGAFQISGVQTLYSNINEIFPSSSKAYIILITSTFLAINFTSIYGWDYGGMLVIGLLSLQWFDPARIGMSIIESCIIYFISSMILRLDFVAKLNIIGVKKILLFFNIAFIYRLIVGHCISGLFPEDRIIEYYGYGYLISTLIALQIDKAAGIVRSVFIIVFTSGLGFVLGSIIALILYFVSGSYEKKIIPLREIKINSTSIEQYAVEEQAGYLNGTIGSYKEIMTLAAKMPLVQPAREEILSIDRFVLKPLSDLVLNSSVINIDFKEKLATINSYASSFGYELKLFYDYVSKDNFIFLGPLDQAQDTKNWGLYIFRLNSANDQILQVPKPFDEVNTLGFALYLFQRTRAGHLFIGGTYSGASPDRSSDLTRVASKGSLYAIVNQVFLREHHYRNLILQIRGYGLSIESKARPDSDVLIALTSGAIRQEQLNSDEEQIIKILNEQGLSYRFVSGDEQTLGYEVGELFLSKYLVQTSNKDLGVLWLSPTLRKGFTDPNFNYSILSHYNILDIETIKSSLVNFLKSSNIVFSQAPPQNLTDLINNYIRTGDIVILQNITNFENYKLKHLILEDDGREYLAFHNVKGNLFALVSLNDKIDTQEFTLTDFATPRIDLSSKRWINFSQSKE